MRNSLVIIVALVALSSMHTVNANCGKTSAFRYEFESWIRRYVLEVMRRASLSIENIFSVTLSEIDLGSDQVLFQNSLNDWNDFSRKISQPKVNIEEILKEFRNKFREFNDMRYMVMEIVTKNIYKAIDELESVREIVAQQFVDEILLDWRIFRRMEDFKTLAQQEDCKEINDIIESLRTKKDKDKGLIEMSRALFEIFDMHKWSMLLSPGIENSVY